MTKTILAYQLDHIQHYYGHAKVLDIDSLKIRKGSITGLIGPNGSGKSTLLKLLAFAQKPTRGDIFYQGRREVPFSPSIRSRVTLLTQKPYLLKRTVFDNIAYGLVIRKDKNNLEERVKKALLPVGLDDKKFSLRKWHQLSGGEAQRVAMAARLILKPDVLLLDEAIASVDAESAGRIRDASIQARNEWGATLVIASHDLQWIYSISDEQLSIFKGMIFPGGEQNIITGPFIPSNEKTGQKTVIKQIGEGQVIRLKSSLSKSQTAMIQKENIALTLEKKPGNKLLNQLSGHIVSMLLERKTNHIMATISVYNLSFVLRLMPEQIGRLDLFPGKRIVISFHADDVKWI